MKTFCNLSRENKNYVKIFVISKHTNENILYVFATLSYSYKLHKHKKAPRSESFKVKR